MPTPTPTTVSSSRREMTSRTRSGADVAESVRTRTRPVIRPSGYTRAARMLVPPISTPMVTPDWFTAGRSGGLGEDGPDLLEPGDRDLAQPLCGPRPISEQA